MSTDMMTITKKGNKLVEERSFLKKSIENMQQLIHATQSLLQINHEEITQLLLLADAQEPSAIRKNVIQMLTHE